MNKKTINNTLALLGGTPVFRGALPPYRSLGIEERRAVSAVMKSGVLSDFIGRAGAKFLGGDAVLRFERAMQRTFRVAHAVSFNSATTALQAAVTALGIGPGDEVITTPYTMSATPSAILLNNAVPVFADIDDTTFTLDPAAVEARITPRTKAILTVNIFGGSSRFDELCAIAKKHGLFIIEDNAQSIGAMYHGRALGTVADIGVFSFNVHKHLQSGEGGVLVTNNSAFAFRAQLVRNHGEVVMDDLAAQGDARSEAIVGSNYRLSELHAAVALEQLKKMRRLTSPRVRLADRLTRGLRRFPWLTPAHVLPESTHVYYVYPFLFSSERAEFSRATFARALVAEGFPVNEGYLKPLYLMPLYQEQRMYPRSQFPFRSSEYGDAPDYRQGICPTAERLYNTDLLFTTICRPPLTPRHIDLFLSAIDKIWRHRDALIAYEKNK